MTNTEKYIVVFRAAAEGVMRPYQILMVPGAIVLDMPNYHEDKSRAQSIAGAFDAIADVFQRIVDTESE